MNRITGLILALAVSVTMGACATTGSAGSGEMTADGTRPTDNRHTREANREIGMAAIRQDPEQQREHYQRALESALLAIGEAPDNPRGWYLAGQAYANLGDYIGADTAFTKAQELYPPYEAQIDPEREQAWVIAYNTGVEALQQNDLDEAIAQMENANRIYSKRPEARLNLGSFYANQNETEKAIEAYRGALEILRGPARETLDPEFTDDWDHNDQIATLNLGQLLSSLGRDAEAEQVYREYLERYPGDISALVNLADALVQQEKIEESAEIYNELLSRDDLTERDYLIVGVGLFQADDFAGAAGAFRRTVELNPYSRDAYYNLAQSLYVMTTEMVAEREKATGAEVRAINEQLRPIYLELASSAEKVLEMDPLNRNIIAFMVSAYQGLAEMSEGAQRNEHLAQIQKALDLHEQFRFEVVDVNITPGDEIVRINGMLRNINAKVGEDLRLRLHILSETGAVVGSHDVSVSAPAAEGSVPFQAAIQVSAPMAGWKYEVLD